MQIEFIPQSAEIISAPDGHEALRLIERIGRVSHKSEGRIADGSAADFVRRRLYDDHHDSLLEHASFTARFTCDRAIANEITRHRMASFCQESTRYCNYAGDRLGGRMYFVKPGCLKPSQEQEFMDAMRQAADTYESMIMHGCAPEIARSVLPLALKTELYMTANLREWRHFFKLRTDKSAHPLMRELAGELLEKARGQFQVVFDEI